MGGLSGFLYAQLAVHQGTPHSGIDVLLSGGVRGFGEGDVHYEYR